MSPIPDFDHNHVLPPHLGNPTTSVDLSPYKTSTMEFCSKFATSRERIQILIGFLNFRIRMTNAGITQGFQWLDGSFLENIETSELRPPNDLDLTTFFGGLDINQLLRLQIDFPEFSNPILSKAVYRLDHYPVDYTFSPDATVELTRYWIQLFTHNRSGVWKGILQLPLNTIEEDTFTLDYLTNL